MPAHYVRPLLLVTLYFLDYVTGPTPTLGTLHWSSISSPLIAPVSPKCRLATICSSHLFEQWLPHWAWLLPYWLLRQCGFCPRRQFWGIATILQSSDILCILGSSVLHSFEDVNIWHHDIQVPFSVQPLLKHIWPPRVLWQGESSTFSMTRWYQHQWTHISRSWKWILSYAKCHGRIHECLWWHPHPPSATLLCLALYLYPHPPSATLLCLAHVSYTHHTQPTILRVEISV